MRWFYLILGIISLSSCIKEDETFEIRYRPSLFLEYHFYNDTAQDVVSDRVLYASYYIFDEKGNQYVPKNDVVSTDTLGMRILWGVPEGNYTVVTCGNLNKAKVSGSAQSNMKLSLSNETKCTGTDNLFMNIANFEVKRGNLYKRSVEYVHCSYRILMEISASSLAFISDVHDINVYLENSPAGYDFKGNMLTEGVNIYPQFSTGDNQLMKADFYVHKFTQTSNVNIVLENTVTGNVTKVPLSEYISGCTFDIDLTKKEVVIPIKLDVSPVSVTVTINGWVVGSIQYENDL